MITWVYSVHFTRFQRLTYVCITGEKNKVTQTYLQYQLVIYKYIYIYIYIIIVSLTIYLTKTLVNSYILSRIQYCYLFFINIPLSFTFPIHHYSKSCFSYVKAYNYTYNISLYIYIYIYNLRIFSIIYISFMIQYLLIINIINTLIIYWKI